MVKRFSNYFDTTSRAIHAENDFERANLTHHRIDTETSELIKQPPRRVPLAKQKEVNTLIKDMQEQGVIERSNSLLILPIVLVQKKGWNYKIFLFKNVVLPFGLCKVPATFESLTETVLQGLVYLDGVIIVGRTCSKCDGSLRETFHSKSEIMYKEM